jgi:polyphenol oxidase
MLIFAVLANSHPLANPQPLPLGARIVGSLGRITIMTHPTWQWQAWNDYSYLTCSLLADWPHGFFTRQFAPQTPELLVEVLQPGASVYRLKQIHSNQVLNPEQILSESSDPQPTTSTNETDEPILSEGDGIYSNAVNQSVWSCTADCTPVLMADCATGMVAAVHAGWRGTAAQIVPRAVAHLQAQGSQLPNLRIAMGPAISGKIYQVSEEVAIQVGTSLVQHPKDGAAILAHLYQYPIAPLYPDDKPGHVCLDVPRVNALQLQALGVKESQIAIAPFCTYQNQEYFFSYRRENRRLVQWSGIVSTIPAQQTA